MVQPHEEYSPLAAQRGDESGHGKRESEGYLRASDSSVNRGETRSCCVNEVRALGVLKEVEMLQKESDCMATHNFGCCG